MTTLLLSDETMIRHDPGPGHPERPDRLRVVRKKLHDRPLEHVRWQTPAAASEMAVRRVHEGRLVDAVLAARGRRVAFDSETVASPASTEAALLAAGAVFDGIDAVMHGEARNAFALVRPPGHHAEPARAMGFCLLNNIAIGAAAAIADHGCERVLVVDWDVHHGNGTQAAFYDRRDVLFFSTHEWPLYPGTGWLAENGVGAGLGYTVNAPLPAGLDDAAYLAVYEQLLEPIADAYEPEIVLVSAGFDAHEADPLANMRLTEVGFAALLRLVMGIADRHAGGRLVLVLEGGYDLAALAASVHACVAALDPSAAVAAVEPAWDDEKLQTLRAAHRRHGPW